MVRWRCFYHAIWAVKNREPLLNVNWDSRLKAIATSSTENCKGELLAFGAAPDHVHILYTAPPHIAPMEFVRRIKTATSTVISHDLLPGFYWQEGYMVRTVDEASLPRVRTYVLNQRTHHADKTISSDLELTL